MDMRVDRESGVPEGLRHHYAGRFVPHPWQRFQFREGLRHLGIKPIDQLLRQPGQSFGFLRCQAAKKLGWGSDICFNRGARFTARPILLPRQITC